MNEEKPILSIETSGSLCGACVYFSDKKYFEFDIRLKNSHAEKLFEAIDNAVKASGITSGELNAIAVSSGPGSFTGLRIGMSAAKGMAFAASLPIITVPTFEATALQISKYLPDSSIFSIANKVNSDEIYFAKFKVVSNNYIFVENLRIIKNNELPESSGAGLLFGNAAVLLKSEEVYGEILNAPSPRYVAEWAKRFGDKFTVMDFDYLEPNYLKNFIIKEKKNV